MFAVDFSTKCSDHGLDVGLDHAWVDDTGLYVWILSSALEASACLRTDSRLLSCFTGLLQCATCRSTHTTGASYFHLVLASRHHITRGTDILAFHAHGGGLPSLWLNELSCVLAMPVLVPIGRRYRAGSRSHEDGDGFQRSSLGTSH